MGIRHPTSGPAERRVSGPTLASPEDGEAPAADAPGGAAREPAPLSQGQRSIWFLHHLAPESGAYNIAAAARVRTPVDAAALARAAQALVDRHAALRTTFPAVGGEPRQRVADRLTFTLGGEETAGWSAARLAARLAAAAWAPFDLERGPLLRLTLLAGDAADPVLLLVIHHIVADFWSLAILMRELPALYREAAGGGPARLGPPGLAYAEHVRQEQELLSGRAGEDRLAWWRRRLAGLPTLELATDRPRRAVQTYRGNVRRLRLPAALAADLRARSRARHGNLFTTLIAGWQALLGRHTGQDDLAIGSQRAGRGQSQFAGTVGYFVNSVVLRGDLAGDPGFGELCERARASVVAAFEHDYPLPLLAEHLLPDRDASRTPLFQVSLVLQKETRGVAGLTAFALGEAGVKVDLGELRLDSLSLDGAPAPFDLLLHAVERQEGLSFALQYNADLFDATTAASLLERFATLLRSVVASPDLALSALPILPAAERHQLLAGWNDSAGPGCEQNLFELFAAQAERTPEAAVLVFEDERLTYGELAARATTLARRLAALGVGPEVLVGVAAERSVELVVGLLGVLAAGGAYLPLEPGLPRRRLATILEDARPAVVLAGRAEGGGLPLDAAPGAHLAWLDGPACPPPPAGGRPLARAAADNAAYVIFTSGSTGRPKGVVNSHRGIVNRLLWMQEAFALGPGDRVLQKTPFGFDVSVWELFAPLVTGGCLVVARPDGHRDSAYLAGLVEREEITTLHFVPSMLPFFLAEDLAGCRSLRRVIVSGEALPWEVEQRCLERLAAPLYNLYGPTEAAVEVTAWACQPAARPRRVPIGRPIRNTRIHLVGPWLEAMPPGAVGELAIGGVQVARGYAGRPDLTAERFVPDPHGGAPGARLYRTGDLCRQLPGGEIEYLRRLDDQVKIRGFRIEPREVEVALAAHQDVREVAVVVREDPGGERSLLACVVAPEGAATAATAAALGDFLAARLPPYMVPAFAFGRALDRLPNGKLDRRALARWTPTAEAERPIVAARTPLAELLAGIFADVLGVQRIGVTDGFFELGGHSLAAMRLSARVREALGVELPVHRIFELPTVAALVQAIESERRSDAPPLVPVPRDLPLPLSFAQQRLWFLNQLEPASPLYNVPAAVELRGRLDRAVLAAALGEVARRHEALRTRLVAAPGGPVQIVDAAAPVPLPEIDLVGLPAAARLEEARRLAREEARRPFDLAAGPLLRSTLVTLDGGEHLLLLTLHHVVSDGWSLRLLAGELGEIYGACLGHRPSPLPGLAIQYGDYAVWQRRWLQGELLLAELAHWRVRLADAPPVLDLPLDRPRPAQLSHRGAGCALALPPALLTSLRMLARGQGVTLFMALLGGFQALLSRLSGTADVSVGTPVAGRGQLRTEGLIGFFVNTLVMRTDLSGEPPFTALLARVREVAVAAYAHQDLPFEKLVEELQPPRALGVSPLFQVAFTLDGEPPADLRLGDLAATLWQLPPESEKFDLSLTLGVAGAGLAGAFGFRTDLFDGPTVERLAGGLVRLLAGAVADPRLPLSDLPLLSAEERRQLLAWNAGQLAGGAEQTLPALFEAQVARAPEAPAVTLGGETWSYGDLNRRANRLARHLRRLGVGPEVRVGALLERSRELVVALLGILKAGGAYVPLDPAAPTERLELLCRDSAVQVLVTDGGRDRLPVGTVVDLGAVAERLAAEDDRDPPPLAGPDHLCYVIFTSGSTGRPKGVLVRHGSVARLLSATAPWFGFGPADVWTLFHSYAFDFSVWELWGALAWGGRLVVVPYWLSRSPAAFWRLLVEERVTVLNQTPAAFRQLIEADGQAPEAERARLALRWVIFGGEALDLASLRPWYERHAPGAPRLVNMYGITETTVHVTWRPLGPGDLAEPRRSPIGEAIPDLALRLLGPALELVPPGVAGEICVGGPGVARGYQGRPELTAERFVPDPFGDRPGERLYRSGDLGRYRPDGRLEYLGRSDQQVKVRGFRVEPGEVEAVLRSHPGVRTAVVLPRQDLPGGVALVAYLATAPGAVAARELRALAAARLPEYMLPAAYMFLESMPQTAHGKLDRRALAALPLAAMERGERGGDGAPRTPAEELVAGIFADLLGAERVGSAADFFALGGHSVLAIQLASRVRAVFAVELPVRVIFEAPTVAALAAWIEERRDGGSGAERGDAPPPIRRAPEPQRQRLSFAQQRLWFLDRLAPGSTLYNIPAAIEIAGEIDRVALAAALTEIVRRHEALRTTFWADPAGEPRLAVGAPAAIALPVHDLTALPAAARRREAARLGDEEARRAFDLARDPLLRVSLLALSRQQHVALVTLHHIAGDGFSIEVLGRELEALYAACREGRRSPLPELALQYADYAAWQRQMLSGARLEAELAFWRRQLAGAPAVLDLPTDRPRPAVWNPRGATRAFALPPAARGGLADLSRQCGATRFMSLLAVFAALLARHCGQQDLAIGTPVAGRTRVETEDLIGLFVNTLVVRIDLRGDPRLAELLGRVREILLSAFAHQELPFERLVEELAPERDPGRPPLVQVMLVVANGPTALPALPDLALRAIPLETGTAKFELTFALAETAGDLAGTVEYSPDLFDGATVERLAGHFGELLGDAVAAPARRLSDLRLLSAAERHQLLIEWGTAWRERRRGRNLAALVAARARRTPAAVALVHGDEQLTYGELDRQSERLARHLRRSGAGPEAVVGVCLEPSPDLVIALFAVWKAGSAFLPLDPAYPAVRLAFMVADSGARLVLTRHGRMEPAVPGARTLLLEALAHLPGDAEEEEPAPGWPENLAYVIYTSGSTGRPKAVAVQQGAAADHLATVVAAWELTGDDRVLVFASPSFDVWIEETVPPLIAGATLVLRGTEIWEPSGFLARIRALALTVVDLPTAYWQQWVEHVEHAAEEPGADLPLRLAVVGGEAMPAPAARRWWRSPLSRARLLNAYGPTETVIDATFYPVEVPPPAAAFVPLGRPLAGRTAHVLDGHGRLVPIGVPGELALGGAGLARAYLNRPELSADRFVPAPFAAAGEAGGRLYRSGDLARLLPDGRLDYLGRIDQQVKVRGFRVEPGEIEAALLAHDGVRAAAVLARQDSAGLAAYVVVAAGAALAPSALRDHLRQRLPEFMLPSTITLLPSLPLTASGKVDRQALSRLAPEPAPASAGMAPRTPAEELVAGIFAEVLGTERVGVEDDFFARGGHSLLATQVTARVRAIFGVELPVREVFEAPTAAGLAARIESATGGAELPGEPVLPRISRQEPLVLSFAQQRLWFIDQLEGGTLFNMPIGLRASGELAAAALARALGEVVRRHEVLRTVFVGDGGQPWQVIQPAVGFALPVVDLRGLPAGRREPAAAAWMRRQARRPFDLARGPLLRATLWRLTAGEHLLLLAMHHIVTDGWSLDVLVREVAALYAAFAAGPAGPGGPAGPAGRQSPLPELAVQYADFAAWQRGWLSGEVLAGEVGWWRERLAGMPRLLELPADRPRPAVQSYRGAFSHFTLPETLVAQLRTLCRDGGATLFMALLAALQALLARLSGQRGFAVGTPIAGRNRLETEALIGFFVNTLVLRCELADGPGFGELLRRARVETLAGYAHQDLPFEKLVEELAPQRNLAQAPLCQAMLVLQNTPLGPLALPGVAFTPLDLTGSETELDLTWTLTESEGGLVGMVAYATDLFDRTTIERWIGHFRSVLAAAVADGKVAVGELPLMGAAERQQLLVEWSGSGEVAGATVGELFAAQAARRGEAVAAVDGERSLSYGELARRAGRLARHLRGLGVGPEVLVGVCAERSLELLVGLVGIVLAGGAYVPLDPRDPAQRLAWLIEDTLLPVVVGSARWLGELPVRGWTQLVELEGAGGWGAAAGDDDGWDGGGSGAAGVAGDGGGDMARAGGAGAGGAAGAQPDNLVYVMYTSGSTGQPKGVGAVHRGVVRLVRDGGFADLGPGQVLLQLAPLAFDASTLEIWGALLGGGRLVVAPPGAPSLAELGSLLAREQVTTLWLTAGLFHELVAQQSGSLSGVRQLLAGGDVLQPQAVERVLAEHPGLALINGYGPTENTTFTSCCRMGGMGGMGGLMSGAAVRSSVPVGRPVGGRGG
jgi:amino acid adenylation domain-containing protein